MKKRVGIASSHDAGADLRLKLIENYLLSNVYH